MRFQPLGRETVTDDPGLLSGASRGRQGARAQAWSGAPERPECRAQLRRQRKLDSSVRRGWVTGPQRRARVDAGDSNRLGPHLIVGVNGARKTTFYYCQLKPYLERSFAELPFVNANEIQRTRGLTVDPQDAYQAAQMAAKRRAELLEQRRSFVAETVFSHPSKVDLIREAKNLGFRVFLYHLHVRTPELAVKRVEARVLQGGHDVPPHKVAERFPRTLTHVREAVAHIGL